MNYIEELQTTSIESVRARQAAVRAEGRRDDLIRAAHTAGYPTREIATAVELSFQRVASIVARETDRPKSRTLHEAIQLVLADEGGDWMPVHEIARAVYERELYRRRDRGVIHPAQIRARIAHHPELFEGSSDGSNTARLLS